MKAIIFFLFLGQNIICSLGAPKWPDVYYVEGEKINLIQHSVYPFKMWIDEKNLKMRNEVYDGQIKTYFDYDNGTYIFHYKADKAGNAELVCTEGQSFGLDIELLPELEGFELTGKKIHEGKRIQVWTSINNYGDTKYEETMYVYRNKPVKYIYRTFDTIKGNLIAHYIVKYFEYTKKVKAEDFKIDISDCKPINFEDEDLEKSLLHYNPDMPADFEVAFFKYKTYHGKKYEKSEHELRKTILKENWKLVKEHNNKNMSFKLALNKFADRTPAEMRRINAVRTHKPAPGTHPFPYSESQLEEMVKEMPEEFDWRILGAVSKVKAQGSCGSCWAFATTAAIEGALAVKYGTNFDLSEQSIVDCAWPYEVYGCDGGYSERAMQYVEDHGIPTEEEYGDYLEMDGKCHINNMTRTYKIKGHVAVTPMSVNALKAAVYKHGPVAAYVQVDMLMGMYSNGILTDLPKPTSTEINHVVTVVGYGVRDGDLFWIVKNSWGEDWGQDGYILISSKDNTGNLLFAPYYPIV